MSAGPPLFLFGRAIGAIHCVGVGGMGLGPLAIYLAGRGYRVSGEDDALSRAMADELGRAGIRLTARGAVPDDCALVAYSSAVAPEHPSIAAARARGLLFVRRGELLAEATRAQRLVAVCGSHGKTTTTAMVVSALRAVRFPAGYVLGGLFNDPAIPPAATGDGEWVVAEVDESDGTIECFAPELTVVVNLDWDHPDRYRSEGELEAAFAGLLSRTTGTVLSNEGCEASRRVRRTGGPSGAARQLTFGPNGDFRGEVAAESGTGMTLSLSGGFQTETAHVRATGAYNAANATAALAAVQCMGAGLTPDVLAEFPGVRRRQVVLHRDAELTVIEDYAHHPAEIRALLGGLRASHGARGRLVVVFQPHRFSRTRQFRAEFAVSLEGADAVYLLDTYGAGEVESPGGGAADLQEELRRHAPNVPVVCRPRDIPGVLRQLARETRPGDLVAFIGAGDIDQHARSWLGLRREGGALPITASWDELATELRDSLSADARVQREEPLAPKTTLRVGGNARVYVEPADRDDLQCVVRIARARDVALHVLGRGSNLLVPDAGVDGIVVSLRRPRWEGFEPLPDGRVRVGAGLRLKQLCGLAMKAGLGGFEFLEGIPGNVGGALRMNAGAMGGGMFDVVDEVEVVTFDAERRTFRRSEMHVDYRHCAELEEAIAVGAVLRPVAAASETIGRQVDTYREQRQKSQPRESSAGCIFKNPPGDSAGRLIDGCGLKGERVGDAEVSTVHGNFIVNRGAATCGDVIALVRRIRARVEQQTGVRLQPEVLLYGARWEDVL